MQDLKDKVEQIERKLQSIDENLKKQESKIEITDSLSTENKSELQKLIQTNNHTSSNIESI